MYKRFQYLLEINNDTCANVSRATGITEGALSNWKRRGTLLSLKSLIKIARYFDVPVSFFTNGVDV